MNLSSDIAGALPAYQNGIPENLYVIGTVNMDETTFPFSRKVLDRANTIEFNYVDLAPSFDAAGSTATPLPQSNGFLKTEYLVLARDCAAEETFVREICGELRTVNEILRTADAHVGYRVRDEIAFYLINNRKAGNLLTDDQAFDNEILQKILPRIQGSSEGVRRMLCDLFGFCTNRGSQNRESDPAKMEEILKSERIQYRKSAEKIAMMVRRFAEDGFTSYWL